MSLFNLHDKINASLLQVFNVISDINFAARPSLRNKISKNAAFKHRNAGKRCFIVATGPSLRFVPPDKLAALQDECVFGVNSMYKADIVSKVIPQYYVLVDNHYWGDNSSEFRAVAEKYSLAVPTFITDVRAGHLVPEAADKILIYAKNYPVRSIRADLSGNMSITMNVVGTAIVSAIFMGFTEIYLLGCDYNLFCSRLNNHCYSDTLDNADLPKQNLSFYLKYYHITTEFHYLIAKLGRERGVNIVNLSNGSLLDAYPFLNVSDVL